MIGNIVISLIFGVYLFILYRLIRSNRNFEIENDFLEFDITFLKHENSDLSKKIKESEQNRILKTKRINELMQENSNLKSIIVKNNNRFDLEVDKLERKLTNQKQYVDALEMIDFESKEKIDKLKNLNADLYSDMLDLKKQIKQLTKKPKK